MLNPKAIRVKSKLANSKKGKSSTEGFPETDYTGDVNKVLGIDKLVESKPNKPAKPQDKVILDNDFENTVSNNKFDFSKAGRTEQYNKYIEDKNAIKEGDDAEWRLKQVKREARILKTEEESKRIKSIKDELEYVDEEYINSKVSEEENTKDLGDFGTFMYRSAINSVSGLANLPSRGIKKLSGGIVDLGEFDSYESTKPIAYESVDKDAADIIKKQRLEAKKQNKTFEEPTEDDIYQLKKDLFIDKVKKEKIAYNYKELLADPTKADLQKKLQIYNIAEKQMVSDEKKVAVAKNVITGNQLIYTNQELGYLKDKIANNEASKENIDRYNELITRSSDILKEYERGLKDVDNIDSSSESIEDSIDLLKINYNPLFKAYSDVSSGLSGVYSGIANPIGNIVDSVAGNKTAFSKFNEFISNTAKSNTESTYNYNLDNIHDVSDVVGFAVQSFAGLAPYLLAPESKATTATFALAAGGRSMQEMEDEEASKNIKYNLLQKSGNIATHMGAEVLMMGGINKMLNSSKNILTAAEKSYSKKVIDDKISNAAVSLVNNYAKKGGKFISDANKSGITGSVVEGMKAMSNNVILGKDVDISDEIANGYVNMFAMHSSMHIAPGLVRWGVNSLSDAKYRNDVKRNESDILKWNDAYNSEPDPVAKEIAKSKLDKAIANKQVLFEKAQAKVGGFVKNQIIDLFGIEQKQIGLKNKYKDIYDNLPPGEDPTKNIILKELENEFNSLETNRKDIHSRNHALSYVTDAEQLQKLQEQAEESLKNDKQNLSKSEKSADPIKDRMNDIYVLDTKIKENTENSAEVNQLRDIALKNLYKNKKAAEGALPNEYDILKETANVLSQKLYFKYNLKGTYIDSTREDIWQLHNKKAELESIIKDKNKSAEETEQAKKDVSQIDSDISSKIFQGTLLEKALKNKKSNAGNLDKAIEIASSLINSSKKGNGFKDFAGEDKGVVAFESNKDYENALIEYAEKTGEDISGLIGAEAAELSNGQLLINKQVARLTGAYNAPFHEVLHKVTNHLFRDTEIGNKIIEDFKATLSKSELEKLQRRIDTNYRYDFISKEEFDSNKRYKQKGIKSEQWHDGTIRIENDPSSYNSEWLSIFSDAVANKEITLTDNLKENLKIFGNKLLNKINGESGSNVSFENGSQVYAYIKDYTKKAYNNDFSELTKKLLDAEYAQSAINKITGNKASKTLAEKLEELDIQAEEGLIDWDDAEMRKKALIEADKKQATKPETKVVKQEARSEQSVEMEAKEIVKENKGSIASDKVQNIYNEKGVNGALEIIKAFRPITSKIANKRRDAPGFNEEDLISEIETGDGGILDLIRTYKPDSGVPLAAYINKQLPLRAIAASKRILDKSFSSDVNEEKGLSSEEYSDATANAIPEKPKYKNAIEANILESEVFSSIKDKALRTVRTMKTDLSEKVSINKTVHPAISEIIKEMGTQADIDIKKSLGGKEGGVLRKNLLDKKRYILENMTTTWLMGKDNGKSVAGGVPQAIQKMTNGRWVNYPEWIGKKIDRESVSTQLAGRTSGHELVRRIPDAFKNVSDIDFLDQFLDPNGNPIRGRKESLSKAMAEEISIDIIKDDLFNDGPIREALIKRQGDAINNIKADISIEFARLAERGTSKASRTLGHEGFLEMINNSEKFADELMKDPSKIQSLITAYFGKSFNDEKDNTTEKLFKTLFDLGYKGFEELQKTKNKLSKTNLDFISDPKNKSKISKAFNTDAKGSIIDAINKVASTNYKIEKIKSGGELTPSGIDFYNGLKNDLHKELFNIEADKELSDNDKQLKYKETIDKYLNKNLAILRYSGGEKNYFDNKKALDALFGEKNPDDSYKMLQPFVGDRIKLLEKEFVSKNGNTIMRKYITVDGKSRATLKYNPTDNYSKRKLAATDGTDYNKIAESNRDIIVEDLEKFATGNSRNVTMLAQLLDMYGDNLHSPLSLGYNYGGYEPGFLNRDNVFEHNPPRNLIIDKARDLLLSKSDAEYKRIINDIKTSLAKGRIFIVSTDFDGKLPKSTMPAEGRYTEKLIKAHDIIGPDGLPAIADNAAPKASKSLGEGFNKILEEVHGVGINEEFSDITARVKGSGKGKYRLFVPPSAEDFVGLLYDFMGKGKAGEAHAKFFQDNLIHPYVKGVERMDNVRANIKEGYKALKAEYPAESKKLKSNVEGKDFTYDQAVRVYLWQTNGIDVPGLSNREVTTMSNTVKREPKLREFADKLSVASGQLNGWVEPTAYWNVESIVSDLHNATEKIGRRNIIKSFIENSEEIFSNENLNKIETALGTNYREALEDSLYRMKNGTNRSNSDKFSSAWSNWIANANGVIMFFNTRSAILQTIAATNYINWSDNNVLAAGKAFLNQPQYWKDFSMIFNSNKLKERREGLKADVNEAELANAVRDSKNKAKAALSYLLKIGYAPTQIADSFAIAAGGATFYRNRLNTYLKQGMSQADAESKAFEDFDYATEESQQSADPSKLSQQQASTVGRLVLAFANVPMQYNRLMKKSFRDLANGRGDVKTHVSKILYYGAIQNVVFSALQNAMFASLFDDDDEEDAKEKADKENKKVNNLLNGMADTILRGTGLYGAIASTAKNVVLRYIEEEEKGIKGDQTKTLVTAVGISPPLGSKAQKLYSAMQTKKFDADVIAKRGFGLTADGKLNPSPSYDVAGKLIAVATNFPADRVVDKVNNVAEALDARNKTWQRIALGLGWNSYSVGVVNEEDDLIKAEAKAARKKEGTEKAKATRKLKSIAKQEKEVRKLDSIANLPEDQIEAYYLNEEIKKQEEKVRKLDSIANLPEDKIEAYYAEKENKKREAALKRKIRKQMMR